jgi:hypothetical protein
MPAANKTPARASAASDTIARETPSFAIPLDARLVLSAHTETASARRVARPQPVTIEIEAGFQ